MKLSVIEGDICKVVRVDAIATLINPQCSWIGGIDLAIKSVAGDMYHRQALTAAMFRGLRDGQVVIAEGSKRQHKGNFDNVIFVVDDFEKPLNQLVKSILLTARNQNYSSVALPLMRTGEALGIYEPSMRATVTNFLRGIIQYVEGNNPDLDVYVVVYNDKEAYNLINGYLHPEK